MSENTLHEPENSKKTNTICNFCTRIAALIIDIVILWLVGFILGSFLFDFLVGIGYWALFIGYVIAVLYYGILNSEYGNGQTIGKRLTLIKVVDSNSKYIPLQKSFLRATVLVIPLYLNGSGFISWTTILNPVGVIIAILFFTALISLFYLYIFNSGTRQSIHDLVSGTYVVRSHIQENIIHHPIWKGHLVIIIMLVLILMIGSRIGIEYFADIKDVKQLSVITNNISKEEQYKSVSFTFIKSYQSGTKTEILQINAYMIRESNDLEQIAIKVFSKIDNNNDLEKYDYINVNIVYGIDFGFSRQWKSYPYTHSIEQWREKLEQSSQ